MDIRCRFCCSCLRKVCQFSIRCENCVENKFSKGTGFCPTCKTELKKNTFRFQIFEDPFIELEVDIRKRILKE